MRSAGAFRRIPDVTPARSEVAYARAVAEFRRACKCCGTVFLLEIRIGNPYRYCQECRERCLTQGWAIRAGSPHRQ